jgi:hypothetical protein
MADVILNVTIPDAHVASAVQYMALAGGARLRLEIDKPAPDPSNDLRGEAVPRTGGVLIEQQSAETNKQYGERILKTLGVMLFDAIDKFLDERDRYRPQVAAVVPPESDVPDDILT